MSDVACASALPVVACRPAALCVVADAGAGASVPAAGCKVNPVLELERRAVAPLVFESRTCTDADGTPTGRRCPLPEGAFASALWSTASDCAAPAVAHETAPAPIASSPAVEEPFNAVSVKPVCCGSGASSTGISMDVFSVLPAVWRETSAYSAPMPTSPKNNQAITVPNGLPAAAGAGPAAMPGSGALSGAAVASRRFSMSAHIRSAFGGGGAAWSWLDAISVSMVILFFITQWRVWTKEFSFVDGPD